MYGNLYQKRVLVPFWVVQLLFVLILVVSLSLSLAFLKTSEDLGDGENASYPVSDYDESVYRAARIAAGVWLAICCVTIIFDIVEIVSYARKRLSPVVAVVLNTITTIVWVVFLVLSLIGIAQSRAALGFIWIIVVFATCLGKLIYVSVILHRFRKSRSATRGAYTPAQAEAGLDTSYTAYNPAGANNLAAAPLSPFRDSSRDPSPAPQQPPGSGAAASYYGAPTYEMQNSSSGRYT
ncbi:hypothetical protein DOTSEDRAFT_83061 [Dothistroma septosporum NZE10]|uniref:MARVEL domain-containing protein n=1 Tax=Dothistroma septosporum (strain NZE10 / CBS 128990) TaxID=675120 RepID=M2WJV9_DOTSN|nr:hypothetical protein DOTSEDRAFT_83061 [Dothistroma septosporum NZE10]